MFVYLSKKIAIPNGVHLRCASWNAAQGWIACGGESGMLKVLRLESGAVRGGVAGGSLTMNQTLEGHGGAVTGCVWNPSFPKLTTSDSNGLIIVWMLHKGSWFEEMINNRNKGKVADMAWSTDGQKIAIAYDDGHVIVGGVGGKREWGKDLPISSPIATVLWSPDGQTLVFGTTDGTVRLYDAVGNPVGTVPIAGNSNSNGSAGQGPTRLVAIDWFSPFPQENKNETETETETTHPCLAIGFENGNVLLQCGALDKNPNILRTGLRVTHVQWNPRGTVLCVAGVHAAKDVNAVHFYATNGALVSSLKIPGTKIAALTWESGGLRVGIAVDSFIYFANIVPDHVWGFCRDTLVYLGSGGTYVIFRNVATNATATKQVPGLRKIAARGDFCVLATETDTPGSCSLRLCTPNGSVLGTKTVEVEPLFLTMTETFVVVASHSSVYAWRHDKSWVSGVRDTESVFRIDSVVRDTVKTSSGDPIAALAANRDTALLCLRSGKCVTLKLPTLAVTASFSVKCRPKDVALNCTNTKFSVIDTSGVFGVFDLPDELLGEHSSVFGGAPPGDASRKEPPQPLKPKFTRKDTWQQKWSLDDESACATMEKHKMLVWRGETCEEPVLSSAHIGAFENLVVTAVLLDEILAMGNTCGWRGEGGANGGTDGDTKDKSFASCVLSFDTKPLRDTRALLLNPSAAADDALQFVEHNDHPSLWALVATHALRRGDLKTANKAFVKSKDYHGVTFVKRLKSLHVPQVARAEIAAYFTEFDDAETLFTEIDRNDLALELRRNLGDWFRVEKLLLQNNNAGAGANLDDGELRFAWNNIGLYFSDRKRWRNAVPYFAKSRNLEALADCYTCLGEFGNLELVLDELCDASRAGGDATTQNKNLLRKTATAFAAVGMCDAATRAFVAAGDPAAAIATCVAMNRWATAVALAERHEVGEKALPLKALQTHARALIAADKIVDAIDLYRLAGKHSECSLLFVSLAKTQAELDPKANAVRVKKLFVLAALERGKADGANDGSRGVTGAKNKNANVRFGDGGIRQNNTTERNKNDTDNASALAGLFDLSSDSSNRNVARSDTVNESAQEKEKENGDFPDDPWRPACAWHFWLLAQKQLYAEKFEYARRTCLVLQRYVDVLHEKDVWSLIALTSFYAGHFGRCSHAFQKLEGIESAKGDGDETENAFSDLATAIFLKHPPVDPLSQKKGAHDHSDDLFGDAFDTKRGNTNYDVCVASGRKIGAADKTRACAACARRAIESELSLDAASCPLCYTLFAQNDRVDETGVRNDQTADTAEDVFSPTAPQQMKQNTYW